LDYETLLACRGLITNIAFLSGRKEQDNFFLSFIEKTNIGWSLLPETAELFDSRIIENK